MLLFFLVLRSACIGTAGRPCIIGRILGVVAQVSDPRAVAVARREVDAVRRSQHLFQVPLAVGQRLPQIEVDTALICGQQGQLLVHRADDVRGKARLLRCGLGADGRDGLHIDDAVLPQRLAQHVQHLAVVSEEAVCRAHGGQGVGTQQDIQFFGLSSGQHVQRDFLAPHTALDGAAVDDGIRTDAGVAADECSAEVDLIVGEAHRQAVAEEGGIGEVAQIDLAAGGLADDAAVVGFDAVGSRRLTGRAELLEGHGGRAVCRCVPPAADGAVGGAVRRALHGQRGQNVLRRAVGRHGGQLFGLCLSVLEDGRDGEAHQQDAGHGPRKPDDAAGAASAAPARAMIIV